MHITRILVPILPLATLLVTFSGGEARTPKGVSGTLPSHALVAVHVPHESGATAFRPTTPGDPYCVDCLVWSGPMLPSTTEYYAHFYISDDCYFEPNSICSNCDYLTSIHPDSLGQGSGWSCGSATNFNYYPISQSAADAWVEEGCPSVCLTRAEEIAALLPEMEHLVQNGKVGALAALVEDSDHLLVVSERRAAIQAEGCKEGTIAVHVPIGEAMAMRLRSSLDSLRHARQRKASRSSQQRD